MFLKQAMESAVSSVSFGEWIKQRRKALDLTQERLAQAVGCSVVLIRKIESEERRPSRQIARLLAKALQVPPQEQDLFVKIARQERDYGHLPQPAQIDQPRLIEQQPIVFRTLPAPATPFVGREHELATILQLVLQTECRMLTLVGPGGIGKTRLALESAHAINSHYAEQFTDGIVYIPLTQLSSSSHLIQTIADHLQVRLEGARQPPLQLLSHLENKIMLLVLDNLEQLLPARNNPGPAQPGIDFLSQILASAPGVKLILTSRERLNLHGEWLFELSGLPVPEIDNKIEFEITNALQYSSISLFLQQAHRVTPDFNITSENLDAIIQICQMVEGFPLGIELAASWARVLPTDEIAAEIEKSLDFLEASTRDIPARHRSLRAVFDHSWALLTEEEQDLLGKLSIFQGGFDRQAAEKVCAARLADLFALVDKSLLFRSNSTRYELHELIHQYAAEKFSQRQDDLQRARASHSRYYLALLQASEAGLKSQAQREVGEQLALEMNNLRAAWNWAVESGQLKDIQNSLRCLHWFYEVRGQLAEGASAFHEASQKLKTAGNTGALHIQVTGHCLAIEGWFAFRLGQLGEARSLLKTSLQLLDQIPDSVALNEARAFLGALSYNTGEYEQAIELLDPAIRYGKSQGDSWLAAQALGSRGRVAQLAGHYDQANALFSESLTYWEKIGDLRGRTYALSFLGVNEVGLGQYMEASHHLRLSLELSQATGDAFSIGTALNHLGLLAYKRGDSNDAVEMFEQGISIFAVLGEQASLGWVCNNLGHSHLAAAQYEQAAIQLRRAMQIGRESQITPLMLDALAGWGILQAHSGATDQAASLLAGIVRHPAVTQSVRERVRLALAKMGYNDSEQNQLTANAQEILPEILVDQVLRFGQAIS